MLRSVGLEAMHLISLCGSNETSYQREAILLLGDKENRNKVIQLPTNCCHGCRRSLAWDHFKLKNDKVCCKHHEAVCKYNTTMNPMMYDLKNVT